MISAKKSRFKRILIIIITVFFSFCMVSLAATKVIYDSIFKRYDAPIEIPQSVQTPVQHRRVCQFPSGDNLLTGYYYNTSTSNGTDALLVMVPGFHAGADDYLLQIQALLDYGWNIFIFDTTGTLQSQGESQVGFSQALLDLDAALEYIRENQLFGHSELILMGHSRGAYAACCALAQEQDIAAAISISGVNSAMDAIMQSSVQAVGAISYGNYGFLWLYQASLFGADTLNQEAAQAISNSNIPVLVVQGSQDPATASSIFSHKSQITSSQVEYILCDAGHTDLLFGDNGAANTALMGQIHSFLLRSLNKQTER